MADEKNTMLDFCANRIMAMQELQATGTLASGFREAGCYPCSGFDKACPTYTPICWVYESEASIPANILAFIKPGKPNKE